VDLRGFELHPEFPADGIPMSRFGDPAALAERRAQMRSFAQGFDVEIGSPDRLPNTRRALAVAEVARDEGRLHAFWDAAMTTLWVEGRDLGDDAVLRDLAHGAGLEPDATLEAAADPSISRRLDALRAEAADARVQAIPAFLVGDERIVGCQPYDRITAMLERAGASRLTGR